MAETVFGGVIEFLDKLGAYDVILPFMLVFAIVFAILEKTKILGVEEIEGKKYTKKNINAIVSFVISFLVVASTELVRAINQTIAQTVLVLILVILFLMLVGTLMGSGEATLDKYPGWTRFFMVVVFIAIVAILLNALGWLEVIIGLFINYQIDWVATLILIIFIILFIWYTTKEGGKPSKKE